ncbi:MAG: hypothetical protein GC180_00185 [Bacteroidetes bacterium]|nr:hypothetical protein [Bacteroidota bacterium]
MKHWIITGLALGICAGANAQNRRNLTQGDTAIMIGRNRVELTDARRIPTEPKIETPEYHHPELSYSVQVSPLAVPAKIQVPKAERMQKEKEPSYHHNYIKVGYGSNLSPMADAYIVMPGKNGMLAFDYHFMSANGPGYMDFIRNRGGIVGKRYFKKGNLEANFNFKRRSFYFYGYDPEVYKPAKNSDIQQFFQNLGGKLAWETKPLGRNKTYFRAEGDFYSFSDRWKQTENRLNLHGLYRFLVEKNELSIQLGYQMQNFSNDSTSFVRNYIDIQPYYTIRKKNWEMTLGFNSTIKQQQNESTLFTFFPRLEGVYEIEKNQLAFFAGITGQVNKNNFRDFANTNPYMSYNPNLQPSIQQFIMNGGLKGKLTGNTGFVAKVLYTRTKDMPLFVMDTNMLNTYVIINDDIELTQLNGEITHQYSEKFRLALDVKYNFYKTTIQTAAWQLPNLQTKLNMTYNMGDKILLSMDAFVYGKRKSYRINEPTDAFHSIKALGDFNLGLDYRYKKQISAFLRLNNLLGQNFQVWYRYPMYSFNMHAGIAIGF